LGNLYDDYHLKIYQFNVQEMYVFCIIYIPLEWDTLLKIVYLLYDIFFFVAEKIKKDIKLCLAFFPIFGKRMKLVGATIWNSD